MVVRSSDAQCELMILRARVAELEAKAEKWERAARRLAHRWANGSPERESAEVLAWALSAPTAQEEEG